LVLSLAAIVRCSLLARRRQSRLSPRALVAICAADQSASDLGGLTIADHPRGMLARHRMYARMDGLATWESGPVRFQVQQRTGLAAKPDFGSGLQFRAPKRC
jgi:hypothetical protein